MTTIDDFRFGYEDRCYVHLEWLGSSKNRLYAIFLNHTVRVNGQNVELTLGSIDCGDNRAIAVRKFRELRALLLMEEEK